MPQKKTSINVEPRPSLSFSKALSATSGNIIKAKGRDSLGGKSSAPYVPPNGSRPVTRALLRASLDNSSVISMGSSVASMSSSFSADSGSTTPSHARDTLASSARRVSRTSRRSTISSSVNSSSSVKELSTPAVEKMDVDATLSPMPPQGRQGTETTATSGFRVAPLVQYFSGLSSSVSSTNNNKHPDVDAGSGSSLLRRVGGGFTSPLLMSPRASVPGALAAQRRVAEVKAAEKAAIHSALFHSESSAIHLTVAASSSNVGADLGVGASADSAVTLLHEENLRVVQRVEAENEAVNTVLKEILGGSVPLCYSYDIALTSSPQGPLSGPISPALAPPSLLHNHHNQYQRQPQAPETNTPSGQVQGVGASHELVEGGGKALSPGIYGDGGFFSPPSLHHSSSSGTQAGTSEAITSGLKRKRYSYIPQPLPQSTSSKGHSGPSPTPLPAKEATPVASLDCKGHSEPSPTPLPAKEATPVPSLDSSKPATTLAVNGKEEISPSHNPTPYNSMHWILSPTPISMHHAAPTSTPSLKTTQSKDDVLANHPPPSSVTLGYPLMNSNHNSEHWLVSPPLLSHPRTTSTLQTYNTTPVSAAQEPVRGKDANKDTSPGSTSSFLTSLSWLFNGFSRKAPVTVSNSVAASTEVLQGGLEMEGKGGDDDDMCEQEEDPNPTLTKIRAISPTQLTFGECPQAEMELGADDLEASAMADIEAGDSCGTAHPPSLPSSPSLGWAVSHAGMSLMSPEAYAALSNLAPSAPSSPLVMMDSAGASLLSEHDDCRGSAVSGAGGVPCAAASSISQLIGEGRGSAGQEEDLGGDKIQRQSTVSAPASGRGLFQRVGPHTGRRTTRRKPNANGFHRAFSLEFSPSSLPLIATSFLTKRETNPSATEASLGATTVIVSQPTSSTSVLASLRATLPNFASAPAAISSLRASRFELIPSTANEPPSSITNFSTFAAPSTVPAPVAVTAALGIPLSAPSVISSSSQASSKASKASRSSKIGPHTIRRYISKRQYIGGCTSTASPIHPLEQLSATVRALSPILHTIETTPPLVTASCVAFTWPVEEKNNCCGTNTPEQTAASFVDTAPEPTAASFVDTAPEQAAASFIDTEPEQAAASFVDTAPEQAAASFIDTEPKQAAASFVDTAPEQVAASFVDTAKEAHSLPENELEVKDGQSSEDFLVCIPFGDFVNGSPVAYSEENSSLVPPSVKESSFDATLSTGFDGSEDAPGIVSAAEQSEKDPTPYPPFLMAEREGESNSHELYCEFRSTESGLNPDAPPWSPSASSLNLPIIPESSLSPEPIMNNVSGTSLSPFLTHTLDDKITGVDEEEGEIKESSFAREHSPQQGVDILNSSLAALSPLLAEIQRNTEPESAYSDHEGALLFSPLSEDDGLSESKHSVSPAGAPATVVSTIMGGIASVFSLGMLFVSMPASPPPADITILSSPAPITPKEEEVKSHSGETSGDQGDSAEDIGQTGRIVTFDLEANLTFSPTAPTSCTAITESPFSPAMEVNSIKDSPASSPPVIHVPEESAPLTPLEAATTSANAFFTCLDTLPRAPPSVQGEMEESSTQLPPLCLLADLCSVQGRPETAFLQAPSIPLLSPQSCANTLSLSGVVEDGGVYDRHVRYRISGKIEVSRGADTHTTDFTVSHRYRDFSELHRTLLDKLATLAILEQRVADGLPLTHNLFAPTASIIQSLISKERHLRASFGVTTATTLSPEFSAVGALSALFNFPFPRKVNAFKAIFLRPMSPTLLGAPEVKQRAAAFASYLKLLEGTGLTRLPEVQSFLSGEK